MSNGQGIAIALLIIAIVVVIVIQGCASCRCDDICRGLGYYSGETAGLTYETCVCLDETELNVVLESLGVYNE